jgi:hypothetical protein
VPPLPVITGVYRISCEFEDTNLAVGVIPVNVFHVRSASGTASAVGTLVAAQLSSHGALMFDPLYTGLFLNSIEVLPLDGSTAQFPVAVSPHFQGGGSGGVVPAAAAVVSLHSTQRGSRGRGRVYVGPLGETQYNNGSLASTSQSNMLTAWGQFVNGLNSGTPSTQLVIASYKHADAHDVSTIRIDTVTGTQRRRLNQLRA